jgi:hypothetical protein
MSISNEVLWISWNSAVPVTLLEVLELDADDAGKGGPHQGSLQRRLTAMAKQQWETISLFISFAMISNDMILWEALSEFNFYAVVSSVCIVSTVVLYIGLGEIGANIWCLRMFSFFKILNYNMVGKNVLSCCWSIPESTSEEINIIHRKIDLFQPLYHILLKNNIFCKYINIKFEKYSLEKYNIQIIVTLWQSCIHCKSVPVQSQIWHTMWKSHVKIILL